MRVTNSMLVSNFLHSLNGSMNRQDKLLGQMASNRKYAHISDDPVSVIFSQQANNKLSRLSDYTRNIETAGNWLKQSETGIMELNEVIKSAYEATIDASTEVKTKEDKQSIAAYVKQLRDHLVDTLNTSLGDRFLFGGYNSTGYTLNTPSTGPFSLDDQENLIYNGFNVSKYLSDLNNGTATAEDTAMYNALRDDVMTLDVGLGVEVEVTVNGLDLISVSIPVGGGQFEHTNLFNIMDDLYKSMENGDPAEVISDHITKLQFAQNQLLGSVADIGGRCNRVDMITARYEADEVNYTQMKSDAEDADQAEVIMNFKMAEAVYKAALSSGSYVIQQTLMDFLR